MKSKYADIINLPHHVSKTRAQMPMSDRAAQFSPFAALTGYDAAIKEARRCTLDKIEISSDSFDILNTKFRILVENLHSSPEVSFTYFIPDDRKSGGKYITKTGIAKKIDNYLGLIILTDGTKIHICNIVHMESDLFSQL